MREKCKVLGAWRVAELEQISEVTVEAANQTHRRPTASHARENPTPSTPGITMHNKQFLELG